MTNEEAITMLNNLLSVVYSEGARQGLEMGIAALEKMEDMEPAAEDVPKHECPVCGTIVGTGHNYCVDCGQSAAWEKPVDPDAQGYVYGTEDWF